MAETNLDAFKGKDSALVADWLKSKGLQKEIFIPVTCPRRCWQKRVVLNNNSSIIAQLRARRRRALAKHRSYENMVTHRCEKIWFTVRPSTPPCMPM